MNMRKRLLCRAILDNPSREQELIEKYAKPIYKIVKVYEAKEQEKVQ